MPIPSAKIASNPNGIDKATRTAFDPGVAAREFR